MNYVENVEEYEPAALEQEEPKDKHNMAAIRMPKVQLDFVRRNPQAAQLIGQTVIARTEITENLKVLDTILASPVLFEDKLENGTKEELTAFLKVLNEQIGSTMLFKNLTKEDYEKIQSKFAEAKLDGVVTNCDKDGSITVDNV